MLYLIKSENYIKIGYSENLEKRLQSYNTHNPNYQLIDTIEGDEDLEKTIHRLCKEFKFKNEWFHLNQFIIDVWNNLKTSNFISIDSFINEPTNELNIDYKIKCKDITEDYLKLKINNDLSEKKYKLLLDKFENSLKNLETQVLQFKNLSEENKNLKEQLLEIQNKYINLLENRI